LHTSERRNRNRDERGDGSLDRAEAILGQLEGRHPNRAEYQFMLARCLLADKSGCGSNGALNERQAKAIRILEELVKNAPENPDFQFQLGDTYRSIEWDELQRYRRNRKRRDPEQLAKSVTRLRRGLEVTANLEVRHPNIPQYNLSKKGLHHLLALALQEQGNRTEAAEEYLRAILKQRLVVSQTSDPHRHECWLRDVELSYGQLLRDLGKTEEAREVLTATAKGLEDLIERPEIQDSDSSCHLTEKTLGKTYVTLANIEKSLGNAERAQELLRKAEATGS
jgi:tetratricopeptide (TPR) repeat protein